MLAPSSKEIEQNNCRKLLETFLLTGVAYLAVSFLLIYTVRLTGSIKFIHCAYMLVIALPVTIGMVAWLLKGVNGNLSWRALRDPVIGGLLLISLVFPAHCIMHKYVDSDDTSYVPPVAYYLDHPSTNLSYKIHHIYNAPGRSEFHSIITTYGFPYVVLQGAWSYVSGIPLTTLYYFIFPWIFGALSILGLYHLMLNFSPPTYAAISVLFTLSLLLICDNTHWSYGSWIPRRLQQPKVIHVFLTMPLIASFVLKSFQTQYRRTVMVLSVNLILIASLCFGASGLPFTLLVFILVFASGWITYDFPRFRLKNYLVFLPAGILLVVYALRIKFYYATEKAGMDQVYNQGFPTTFLGTFKSYFGDNPFEKSIIYVLILGFLGLLFFYPNVRERKWVITWLLLFFCFVFNPIVADFWIQNFTTSNLYWRTLFVMPWFILFGLGFSSFYLYVIKKLLNNSNVLKYILITIPALFLIIWIYKYFWQHDKMNLTFRLKVYKNSEYQYQFFRDKLEPGLLLAPYFHSSWWSVLGGNFRFYNDYYSVAPYLLTARGEKQAAQKRLALRAFTNTSDGKYTHSSFIAFKEIVGRDQPYNIILFNGNKNKEVLHFLNVSGYKACYTHKPMTLFQPLRND